MRLGAIKLRKLLLDAVKRCAQLNRRCNQLTVSPVSGEADLAGVYSVCQSCFHPAQLWSWDELLILWRADQSGFVLARDLKEEPVGAMIIQGLDPSRRFVEDVLLRRGDAPSFDDLPADEIASCLVPVNKWQRQGVIDLYVDTLAARRGYENLVAAAMIQHAYRSLRAQVHTKVRNLVAVVVQTAFDQRWNERLADTRQVGIPGAKMAVRFGLRYKRPYWRQEPENGLLEILYMRRFAVPVWCDLLPALRFVPERVRDLLLGKEALEEIVELWPKLLKVVEG